METLEDRALLAAVDFSTAQTFPSGGSIPVFVATGDFDGDGHADLAVVNRSDHNVGVLLGNGSGGFTPSGTFDTGGLAPFSIAVGDFNKDGNADLAVAFLAGSEGVGVLLGDGDGGFAAPTILANDLPSMSLAVGDINNDGWDDLVVGTYNSFTMGVLLANHADTLFASVRSIAIVSPDNFDVSSVYCDSVAIEDFNNDGNADLVVKKLEYDYFFTEVSSVVVLLGDGLGGFAPVETIETDGRGFGSIVVADFDNDGHADLAVAHSDSRSLSLLLGNGAGGFAPAVTFGSAFARNIIVGDFNNDGQADLAAADQLGNVCVLLGTGLGGFAVPVSFDAGGRPFSIAAADFDQDGRTDLAVSNYLSGAVGVLLNTTPQINTIPGGQVVPEDVAKVISGLAVADETAGVVTVTLTVGQGILTLNSSVAAGLTATGISGNGTATVTLTGTQAQVNATLAADDGLMYLGAEDYSGPDALEMTTTDAGGLTDTDVVAIQVLSAQQQADVMAAIIADLGDDGMLTGGQENALVKKLSFLSGSNGAQAVQAFISQVNGLVHAGILTQLQAGNLIASTKSILASMQ